MTSDDPDRPEVAIALFGTQLTSVPLGCDLVLRPTRLELSTNVPVGTIELQNLGAEPCNISAVSVESRCDFMATSPAGPPIRLATGETAEVSVAWMPGPELCEGTLSIASDDPLRPSRRSAHRRSRERE